MSRLFVSSCLIAGFASGAAAQASGVVGGSEPAAFAIRFIDSPPVCHEYQGALQISGGPIWLLHSRSGSGSGVGGVAVAAWWVLEKISRRKGGRRRDTSLSRDDRRLRARHHVASATLSRWRLDASAGAKVGAPEPASRAAPDTGGAPQVGGVSLQTCAAPAGWRKPAHGCEAIGGLAARSRRSSAQVPDQTADRRVRLILQLRRNARALPRRHRRRSRQSAWDRLRVSDRRS